MLKAVTIGRARYHKPGSKFNGFYEDEITSAVFGPLSYMSAGDIWEILVNLFRDRFDHDNWPDQCPDVIDMKFWPSYKPTRDKEVIPDLIIDLKYRNIKFPIFRIIIEVKWQSGASKFEDGIPVQLQEQWAACAEDCESSKSIHIYLVLDEYSARKEINKIFEETSSKQWSKLRFGKDEWKNNLHILTWAQIAMTLEDVQWGENLKSWSDDVVGFLDQLVFPRFTGFYELNELLVEKPVGRILFWVDWEGFTKAIGAESYLIRKVTAPLFWKETSNSHDNN